MSVNGWLLIGGLGLFLILISLAAITARKILNMEPFVQSKDVVGGVTDDNTSE